MKKTMKNIAIIAVFIALLPLIILKAIVKKIIGLYNNNPGLLCGIILSSIPFMMIALFAIIINVIL